MHGNLHALPPSPPHCPLLSCCLESGRELAKFMAAVQASVYGSTEAVLTPEIWDAVLRRKLHEHQERRAFRLGHHGTPGDQPTAASAVVQGGKK